MNKTDKLPPSEQDLKLYYDKERERKAKAIAFDKKSKELDTSFYEKRKEIDDLWTNPDDFKIEEWNPNKRVGWKVDQENFDPKKLE